MIALIGSKVQFRYPRAHAERFTTNSGTRYTLIYSDRTTASQRIGEGDTTFGAWKDALKTVETEGK